MCLCVYLCNFSCVGMWGDGVCVCVRMYVSKNCMHVIVFVCVCVCVGGCVKI